MYHQAVSYLSVNNLSLTIEGKEILKNISFSLEKGTINLLLGLNGSGKTMLLKALKGLEKAHFDSILLDGEEISKKKDRLRTFGLVFQDSRLETVGSTVKRDIEFGLENQGRNKEEIEKISKEMLSLFSLEKYENSSPSILSGGERKKLSVAGVIAMNSKILLMDEPLAALDYPSVLTVLKTITELKERGITILIVSHEAEKLLKLSDYTMIMKNGTIIEKGPSRLMIDKIRENNIYLPSLPFEELSWL